MATIAFLFVENKMLLMSFYNHVPEYPIWVEEAMEQFIQVARKEKRPINRFLLFLSWNEMCGSLEVCFEPVIGDGFMHVLWLHNVKRMATMEEAKRTLNLIRERVEPLTCTFINEFSDFQIFRLIGD